MSVQNQPLTLSFTATGPQVQTTVDDTPLDSTDNVVLAIITQPVGNAGTPIAPNGTPLDLTVNVLSPYNQVTSPGAIVVR